MKLPTPFRCGKFKLIINVISPSTLYRKKRNPKTKTDEDSIAETEANCFGDLGMHAESALRAIVDSRWGLKGERKDGPN